MIRPGAFAGGLRVFEQLAQDANVPRSALLVYAVMALALSGPDGVCYESHARVAELSRLSKPTVYRALRLFDGVVLERESTGIGRSARVVHHFVPLLEPAGGRPLSTAEADAIRYFQDTVVDPAATHQDLITALDVLERACWRACGAASVAPAWPASGGDSQGGVYSPTGAQAVPVSKDVVDACVAVFHAVLKPELDTISAMLATLVEPRSPPAPGSRRGTARHRFLVIQGGLEPEPDRRDSGISGGPLPTRPGGPVGRNPDDRGGVP